MQIQKNSSNDLSWVKNMGWKSLQVSLAKNRKTRGSGIKHVQAGPSENKHKILSATKLRKYCN